MVRDQYAVGRGEAGCVFNHRRLDPLAHLGALEVEERRGAHGAAVVPVPDVRRRVPAPHQRQLLAADVAEPGGFERGPRRIGIAEQFARRRKRHRHGQVGKRLDRALRDAAELRAVRATPDGPRVASARAQHAERFGDRFLRFGKMQDPEPADYRVKGRVGEIERLRIADVKGRTRKAPCRFADHGRREVDAGRGTAAGRRPAGIVARSAAHVQQLHGRPRPDRVKQLGGRRARHPAGAAVVLWCALVPPAPLELFEGGNRVIGRRHW